MPPEDILEKSTKSDSDTAVLDELIGDKDLIDLDEQEGKKPTKKDEVEDDELINEEDEKIESKSSKEDKENEEDDLLEEEDTNTRGIDFKKIKEDYPDFAKTTAFRVMRDSYYREGKLTEIFPTVEDAQEAAENNETFNKINDSLIGRGDPTLLMNAVKEASPESFKKFTTSFLEVLHKIDTPTYTEVITPIVKSLAKQIYAQGKKALSKNAESDDGKALVATARNIMQYAFEDADAIDKDDSPRNDLKVSEKEKELEQRENAIKQEKFSSAYNIVVHSVERNLDKAILQGLDPEGKFNEFTRDTLLEKIKKEVQNQIDKDEPHLKRMTSLWKRSESGGYNRDSLSSIVSAYLERARPIIPTVRNKFRSIAIKGKEDKSDNEGKDLKIVSRGRTGRAPERDGKVNLRDVDTRKIDYSKTSDTDIFEGKVKLRG